MMLRRQRVTRPLDASDGPRVSVVSFTSLASLASLADQRVTAAESGARIEAGQVGAARRMISRAGRLGRLCDVTGVYPH